MTLFSCFVLLLVLAFVDVSTSGDVSGDVNLTIDLGYSKYLGVDECNGISHWLGIRYAAPPVGDLRFRAPQDPVFNETLQIADTVCSFL